MTITSNQLLNGCSVLQTNINQFIQKANEARVSDSNRRNLNEFCTQLETCRQEIDDIKRALQANPDSEVDKEILSWLRNVILDTLVFFESKSYTTFNNIEVPSLLDLVWMVLSDQPRTAVNNYFIQVKKQLKILAEQCGGPVTKSEVPSKGHCPISIKYTQFAGLTRLGFSSEEIQKFLDYLYNDLALTFPLLDDEDNWIDNFSPLVVAVYNNRATLTQELLDSMDFSTSESDLALARALVAAVLQGNQEMVRLLLDHGANPDLDTSINGQGGLSVLETAEKHQYLEIIDMLLAAGATGSIVTALTHTRAPIRQYQMIQETPSNEKEARLHELLILKGKNREEISGIDILIDPATLELITDPVILDNDEKERFYERSTLERLFPINAEDSDAKILQYANPFSRTIFTAENIKSGLPRYDELYEAMIAELSASMPRKK